MDGWDFTKTKFSWDSPQGLTSIVWASEPGEVEVWFTPHVGAWEA